MEKGAYPIILKRTDDGYYVEIPDFDIGTQGDSIAEAMEMARDAIGLMGIDRNRTIRKLNQKKMILSPWWILIFLSIAGK